MSDGFLAGGPAGAIRRFLIFEVGGQRYALAAEDVVEIVHPPAVARLPRSPPALLGMANLRGAVIAVVSVKTMLGGACETPGPAARAIILAGIAPTALVVDAVETIVAVEEFRIETGTAALSAVAGEKLLGVLPAGTSGGGVKLLDIQSLLHACLAPRQPAAGRVAPRHEPQRSARSAPAATSRSPLVSFGAAGQDYALSLEDVREIIALPVAVTTVPRTDPIILGVIALRENLLALLSLRGLLGLAPAPDLDGRAKVVVTAVAGVLVGLVADHVSAIVAADPVLIQPVPAVLAARTGGEARIRAIYRNLAGDRLISILAPATLFGSDVMKRLGDVAPARPAPRGLVGETATTQFLVFRLGAEEFGLPIDAIDEVAALPDKVTRLPKTPKFLEGVVNLRGDVLPIIDQRRRFDMPRYEGEPGRRRLIVLRTARHRAGLIVDSVSEVLAAPRAALEPAPALPGETTSLIHAVLNLADARRMILICDPEELLSRAERGLLASFAAGQKSAA